MKIAFCSDLHLNHAEKSVKIALAKEIKKSNCDMVVISGDIAESHNLEFELSYFAKWYLKPTMFILGNHDFYGSSIFETKEIAKDISDRYYYLKYLPYIGIQELTKDTCLVGWDSMYDCKYGKFIGGKCNFELADFYYINEIKRLSRMEIQHFMISLGKELAVHIKDILPKAFSKYKNVIAVTHIPPFPEVCLYNGCSSELEALPFFCNKQMGEALLDVMGEYTENNLTLLCGHTHSSCERMIGDNFKVIVDGAKYGTPKVFSYIDVL